MRPPIGITENDIVSVNFHVSRWTICHRAKVLHVPCAIGDSWHFEDLDTGDIHYVSEGCTITKRRSNGQAAD